MEKQAQVQTRGFNLSGDVKFVAKALEAIAYFNRGKSVSEIMESKKHFTGEQWQRWLKLLMMMYDQFMEDEEACYPDGTPYYARCEDKGDEGVKPF